MLYSPPKIIKKLVPSPIKSKVWKEVYAVRKFKKLWDYIKVIGIDRLLWLIETFEMEYGHLLSVQEGKPLNKAGEPIPWYTYPAFEYLNQLDFKDKDIFEYGAGNSSFFWAQKARSVTSVESDKEWYVSLQRKMNLNQKLLLIEEENDYVNSIFKEQKRYDVIVIDGVHRLACARAAVQCLAPGGLIILDNSDWFPKTTTNLREAGLIQVDFTGLGPVNYYTWTTSIFLEQNFSLRARSEIQPENGIGSLVQVADPE
jgi:hypothetical protein